jgi:glycosyltransferase involved in cell wall biosynthesis
MDSSGSHGAEPSLRVSIVLESFGAGVLTIVRQVVHFLIDRRCTVQVLRGDRAEESSAEDYVFPEGVEVHQTRMVREISPVKDLQSIRDLRSHWADFRPDVIHLFSTKAGALGRVASAGLPWGRPAVFYSPQGFAFLNLSFGRPKAEVFRLAERILSVVPATVVASSTGELELARRLALRGDVILIPNGVDPAVTQAQPGARPVLTVVSTGRAAFQKAPERFAAAAAAGREFRWVWVGDGPDRTVLESAGVEVTGWVSKARVREILRLSDVYVQCSRWEGLPLAVLEAMATGLPLLATPVVGNEDLVEEGKNGFLVRTPVEIADHVRALDADRARLAAFGAHSRDLLLARYALERNLQLQFDAYLSARNPRERRIQKSDPRGSLGVPETLPES